MLNVHWEVDGKRVTEAELGDAIISAVLDDITEQAQKAVGDMKCPEHGTTPDLTIKYKEDSTVDFECECCCDEFSAAVQAKLEEFLGDDEEDADE